MLKLELNDPKRRLNCLATWPWASYAISWLLFRFCLCLDILWFLQEVSRCGFLFVYPTWEWLKFLNLCGWYFSLVLENSQPLGIQILPLGQNSINSGNCFKIHQQRHKQKERKWKHVQNLDIHVNWWWVCGVYSTIFSTFFFHVCLNNFIIKN